MHEFLWMTITTHPAWLVVLLVLGVIIAVVARSVGVLFMAIVLYSAVVLAPWSWVSPVFWLLFAAGLIGVVWAALKTDERAVKLARFGAWGSLLFVVVISIVAAVTMAKPTGVDPIENVDRQEIQRYIDERFEEEQENRQAMFNEILRETDRLKDRVRELEE